MTGKAEKIWFNINKCELTMMSPLDPTPLLTADQARHDSKLSKKLNNTLQPDRTVANECNKKIDKVQQRIRRCIGFTFALAYCVLFCFFKLHDYFSFTDISFIMIFY
ncbi:hypothetical protein T4B_7532 [Trichinella pseudospiralis]|uniref:Uncharacterized protein n=1 Tax=Trichinella pseudospiralis TaxID=6337 RepID=A0A0V1J961_TRIPS|nr:hypothetical protein T4A_1969 [Trichinella pseudospiralis]KRZ31489.1 hypothetical protein T4B_7532 [Trichinella pseudospiralis]KRZ43017.1 hypothetical protein T4C_405 [Trichinella pseudospiralis]